MKQIILLLFLGCSTLFATHPPARVPAVICTPVIINSNEFIVDSQTIDLTVREGDSTFLIDFDLKLVITNSNSAPQKLSGSIYSLWTENVTITNGSTPCGKASIEVTSDEFDYVFPEGPNLTFHNEMLSQKLIPLKTTFTTEVDQACTLSIMGTLNLKSQAHGIFTRSSIKALHLMSSQGALWESYFGVLSPHIKQWKAVGLTTVTITYPEKIILSCSGSNKREQENTTILSYKDGSQIDIDGTILRDFRTMKIGGPTLAFGGSRRYGFMLQPAWEFGFDFHEEFSLMLREGFDTNFKDHKALSNELVFQFKRAFCLGQGFLYDFYDKDKIWRSSFEVRSYLGGIKFDIDHSPENSMTSTRFMFIMNF